MEKIKVMSVFGTRPEAIKMAPLVLELQRRSNIESIVCVTAQHREMLDSVLDSFNIKAQYDLDIMEPSQTLQGVTTRVLEKLGQTLDKAVPDIVLVHGDTTTTFAGALSSFYHKIPVGHVEAGLRTFDRYSPYPEEMNRCLVGRLADMHFSPTALNAENLRREGVPDSSIYITGNTVIDAMAYTVSREDTVFPEFSFLDFKKRPVVVLTCHRRENYGRPMQDIFIAVRRLAADFPGIDIVYPIHMSPHVRRCAAEHLGGMENIHIIDPLETIAMHNLLSRCYMVLTDSGGLQEEAPSLGKPVLVLRRETERPEAVAAGCVEIAGTDSQEIYNKAKALLTDPEKYGAMARAANPYGDGKAAVRIADAILWRFGMSPSKPEDFSP